MLPVESEAEAIGQAGAQAMDSDFHGALADLEMSCQFGHGQLLAEAELVQSPGFGRQLGQSAIQSGHEMVMGITFSDLRGWIRRRRGCALVVAGIPPLATTLHVIGGQSRGDDQQPAAKGIGRIEAVQGGIGADEGFLGEIIGGIAIHQSAQMGDDATLVAIHQGREGIGRSIAYPLHIPSIIIRGQLHRQPTLPRRRSMRCSICSMSWARRSGDTVTASSTVAS